VVVFFSRQWQRSMPFFVLLDKKHRKKFGGIKNIAYFCGQSWSRRKRTAAMKALVNERIERYLAIEMWKFQSLLTINRQ